MIKQAFLVALLGAIVVSAPADATTSFDFTSGTGEVTGGNNDNNSNMSPLSYMIGGITVTATAYATTAANSSSGGAGDTLVSSGSSAPTVGSYYGYGLGVCSAADGSGCPGSAPRHQIDNHGDYEFILFTFSTPVNLGSIVLASFGLPSGDSTIDMDISYWVNPSSLIKIPAAATNVFCGDSSQGAADQHSTCPTVEGDGTNATGAGSMTDTLSGTDVTTLLVGAYDGSTASPADSTPDYFKIQELNVTKYTAAATPEPDTFGLIGLAFVGLGLLARKRKQGTSRSEKP